MDTTSHQTCGHQASRGIHVLLALGVVVSMAVSLAVAVGTSLVVALLVEVLRNPGFNVL